MIILHIIPPSKRMMNTFIKELRARFSEDRHIFYFINPCLQSEASLFDYGDVYQIQGANAREKAQHFKKYADMADYIVWHGMIYHAKIVLFACQPALLRKSIWLIWGIDLYNWLVPNDSPKNRLKNRINRYWRKHVHAIITLMPVDEETYKKAFPHSRAKCYNIPYPISYEGFETMDRLRDAMPRQNGKVCIQVAHNAHAFNNHQAILDYLSKFADENIELYLPLSYGPEEKNDYIDTTIRATVAAFPNKAKCIRKLMPFDHYLDFMWNMDVSVFYAHRQNALGNITRQLYMGNKIFLSPASPTYAYLKGQGIEVFNTEDIPNMTFEQFAAKQDNARARQWIVDTYLPDNVFALWEKLLVALGGHGISPDYVPYRHHINQTPPSPLYKDNIPNVYKYLSWPVNVSTAQTVAIAGQSAAAIDLYQTIKAHNAGKKNLVYYTLGFLQVEGETALAAMDKYDLGDYTKFNYEQCDMVLCCTRDNAKRQQLFDYYMGRGIVPALLEPISSPLFVQYGKGDVFGGECTINALTEFGDGVLALDAAFGRECKVGSYVFVGKNARVADNVTLDDRVTVCAAATIGASSRLGKDATVGESSVLGAGSQLGAHCNIGPMCRLGATDDIGRCDCIWLQLGDDVKVGYGTTMGRNIVIGKNVNIGKGCTIGNNVSIADGVSVGDNAVVEDGCHISGDVAGFATVRA